MRTFTDTAGRTWTISITVDAIKRVQSLLPGVNLADLTSDHAGATSGGATSGGATSGGTASGGATSGGATSGGTASGGATSGGATSGGSPLLTRLGTDIVLLCDVIYAIVKPQADQLKVTDEQFGQALGGEVIAAASDAFWEELADFFRKLRRQDQAKAVQKQQTLIHAAVRAVDHRIDAMDVDRIVDEVFSKSVTDSPASSGSTRGPAP